MENLTGTSLENNITVVLPDSKCSQKPTVDQGDEIASSRTSNLKKSCRIRGSCRSPCQCVYRLLPVFSSFSCSPIAAGDSCSHAESLPRTVLRQHPLIAAQRERHFAINLDQNAILNGKNNVTAYANPDLGIEIRLNKLARQKTDIGLHSHSIVSERSTTKGSERSRQKNVSGKMKRNARETKKYIPGTKECGRECEESRGPAQKKAAGEGLELVCRKKGSRRTPRRKTIQSRWRRPGNSARNKKK